MRIIVNDKDISQLVKTVKWSGDLGQNARKLSINYLYDNNGSQPQVAVVNGDTVGLYSEDGKLRFIGIVQKVESEDASSLVTIQAADVKWYAGKNKVFKVYEGLPQDITKQVCGDFNISIGVLPALENAVRVVSTGDKTILQVIQEAYGAEYYVYAAQAMLCVEKLGLEVAAVMTTMANVTNAKYSCSIENMVNRVAILNEKSVFVGSVQNDEDLKYGLLQEVYKQEEKKDANTEARKLLKSQEKTCTLSVCPGDWNCVAGKSVYVKDVKNLMAGIFLIKDDSHEISEGVHKMELGVEVQNGAIQQIH